MRVTVFECDFLNHPWVELNMLLKSLDRFFHVEPKIHLTFDFDYISNIRGVIADCFRNTNVTLLKSK